MRNMNVCFQDETYEKIKASESKLNNQSAEQKNDTKLWLGTGIFGLGLVGLVVYLIWKGRKND